MVPWSKVYMDEEVFPWGGNSVIVFSLCVNFTYGDSLPEIDIWLESRLLDIFYGALKYAKVEIIVMFAPGLAEG